MNVPTYIFISAASVALLYGTFWCGVFLGERGVLRTWWPGRKGGRPT